MVWGGGVVVRGGLVVGRGGSSRLREGKGDGCGYMRR
jgi:hypothetical protein